MNFLTNGLKFTNIEEEKKKLANIKKVTRPSMFVSIQ